MSRQRSQHETRLGDKGQNNDRKEHIHVPNARAETIRGGQRASSQEQREQTIRLFDCRRRQSSESAQRVV